MTTDMIMRDHINDPYVKPVEEVFYRYYDAMFERGPAIALDEMTVRSHTERGVWVDDIRTPGKLKFILNSIDPTGKSERRYAYDTIAKAWGSYAKRKRSQLGHINVALERATSILAYINGGHEPPTANRWAYVLDGT